MFSFFMFESSIHFIKKNTFKKALRNIDNSKKSLNHQLKIVILKNSACHEIFSEMFFFSLQICFNAISIIARGLLY